MASRIHRPRARRMKRPWIRTRQQHDGRVERSLVRECCVPVARAEQRVPRQSFASHARRGTEQRGGCPRNGKTGRASFRRGDDHVGVLQRLHPQRRPQPIPRIRRPRTTRRDEKDAHRRVGTVPRPSRARVVHGAGSFGVRRPQPARLSVSAMPGHTKAAAAAAALQRESCWLDCVSAIVGGDSYVRHGGDDAPVLCERRGGAPGGCGSDRGGRCVVR